MAFQVKRKQQVEEELELLDEKGNVIHVIHVSLHADDVAGALSEKYVGLVSEQARISQAVLKGTTEEKMESYERLGNMIISLFQVVFGEENTQTIVEFYKGRYTEMLQELNPFILNIVEQVRKIAQDNRKETMKMYNRKQRREMRKKGISWGS